MPGQLVLPVRLADEASFDNFLVCDSNRLCVERLRALRESAVSATIYPAILLGVAVLSVIAMLGFVVPQFEKLFTDMGDALPLPTQIVMMAGHGFKEYGLILGIVLISLI